MSTEKTLTRKDIIMNIISDKNEDLRGRPRLEFPIRNFNLRCTDEEWTEFKQILQSGALLNTRERYLFFLNAMKNS